MIGATILYGVVIGIGLIYGTGDVHDRPGRISIYDWASSFVFGFGTSMVWMPVAIMSWWQIRRRVSQSHPNIMKRLILGILGQVAFVALVMWGSFGSASG